MAAANTDKFMEVGSPGTATTLSSPGYTSGVSTSITVGSTANWPTATGIVFAIDEATTNSAGEEVRVDGTYNEFIGTVASATSITNVDYVAGDAERTYAAGATTRVYLPVSATRENRLAQGMVVEHDQDGTHGAITTASINNAGALTQTGASNFVGAVTLPASTVTNANVTAGIPVQIVNTTSSAIASGSTVIPFDDTIPQNTEGTEFMTLAITPKSATNILIIEADLQLASDTASREIIAALFQDATANALAAKSGFVAGATRFPLFVRHTMAAGTTSAITFKIRAGLDSAGTIIFNGNAGGTRLYGGITKSSIVITEYKA